MGVPWALAQTVSALGKVLAALVMVRSIAQVPHLAKELALEEEPRVAPAAVVEEDHLRETFLIQWLRPKMWSEPTKFRLGKRLLFRGNRTGSEFAIYLTFGVATKSSRNGSERPKGVRLYYLLSGAATN